ncbi:MAG: hypothetical protein PVG70_04835 [Desulfobacterales bacterium]
MSEKEDYPQESDPTASSDEDIIIDLTDEVVVKTDDSNETVDFREAVSPDSSGSNDLELSFDDEEDLIELEDTDWDAETNGGWLRDIEDPFPDDDDMTIASEIDESIGLNDEDQLYLPEDADQEFDNEDEIFLSDDDETEKFQDVTYREASEPTGNEEGVEELEIEEEIELDIPIDAEEDFEFVGLDEEHGEDGEDIIATAVNDSVSIKDDQMKLAEGLDLTSGEDNDFIDLDSENHEDNDDDFFALAEEVSLDFEEEKELFDFDNDSDLEFDEDADIASLGADQAENDAIISLADEEPSDFDEDETQFEIDDKVDFESEADTEIIPLEDSKDIIAAAEQKENQEEEEIIEITEFDEHFPTVKDLVEPEEAFSESKAQPDDSPEIFELDEESFEQRKETVSLSDSEDERIDHEAMFDAQSDLENNITDKLEKLAAMEPDDVMSAALAASVTDKADLISDSKEEFTETDPYISELSATEPDETTPSEEQPAVEESAIDTEMQQQLTGAALNVTPELLDAALERLINEKFSGRIEKIMYEVIEKAVTKEINRLKEILLDGSSHEDP